MKTPKPISGTLRKNSWRYWVIMLLSVLLILPMFSNAYAQDSVCAEVKIVIEQKLSFERQAFDAKMIIRNGLHDAEVKDVNIELLFLDKNEQPVIGTTDPNVVGAKFFYRTGALSGIESIDGNGRVAADSAAEIHWLIIPASGAATHEGSLYFVGAKVTYTLNDVTTTVDVTPDFIVVKPQPKLTLDYFLPTDVYADDPFTEETEPAVPFTLGVRIQNTGSGAALKTSIESAQPKIVENKLNLLIDFKILGGYVSDEPAGQSLLLNFGDIAANSAKVGRWNMVTTLSGQFVEFNANYSHADELGGAVTSLLEDVRTHTLVHDVKVDLPGRDNIRDFLALDTDVMRVYESDGIDTVVTDQSSTAQINILSEKAQINYQDVPGLSYVKVSDPYQGQRIPTRAVRSDGKVLPAENIWLSKTRNEDLTWSYAINLFDVDTTGSYDLFFSEYAFASISGLVFDDANGNGVLEEGESGVGVAKITLSGLSETGSSALITTYTDMKGQFVFSQVDPGQYVLEVADVDSMTDMASIVGDAGGVAQPGKISGIDLSAGVVAQGYYFGKQWGTPVLPGLKADLSIEITASTLNPNIGEQMTLVYTAHNAGPDLAKQVNAAITWPAGLTHVSCHADGDTPYIDGIWSIGQLYAGTSKELTCSAQVQAFSEEMRISAMISSQIPDADLSNNEHAVTLSPRVGQAQISGIVYEDLNQNGIQDAGEPGVVGVDVLLSEQHAQGGSAQMTMQTNELGFYQFTGLAAATYTLQVSDVDGMEDIRAQAGTSGGISQPGKITDIPLLSGDDATGYNFMKRAFATTSLSGQAVCSTGCDVEGIKVVLTTYIGGRYWEKFTYTDAKGNFVFNNIKGNVGYTLTLLHKEGQLFSNAKPGNAGGIPNGILGGTFFDVLPKEGQPAEGYSVTYRKVSGTGSISGKVFHDLNGNGVQDEGEPGLAGRRATIGAAGIAVTHTDESGSFMFSGLRAGSYNVAVDFDEQFDGVIIPGSAGGRVVGNNLYVSGIAVANGTQAKDYLFARKTDPRGSSLSGIVYEDKNGNGVFDDAENGIEGVSVRLRNTRLRPGMTLEDSVVYTDANGRFTFNELNNNPFKPHTYRLDVGAIEDMVDGSSIAGDAGGAVRVPGSISNITFKTQMQAQGYYFAKQSTQSSLSGVVYADQNRNGVRDASEVGISGVAVTLSGWDESSSPVWRTVFTDPSGGYAFDHLAKGTYIL